MKLIYTSYALMDQDASPDWVGKLKEHPMVKRERWCLYDPALGFTGNFESSVYMAASLSDSSRVSPVAAKNQEALRLDPQLFQPLNAVMKRIQVSDNSPSVDMPFKDLYALMRSDLVLVDLNEAEHGEKSQEVLYAYLFGVPVVGIAHRFILSPWMVGKVNAVVFPATTDEIVAQVLAYDHKNVAALRYLQAASERPAESQEGVLEAARELKKNIEGATADLRDKGGAVGSKPKGSQEDDGRHEGASSL